MDGADADGRGGGTTCGLIKYLGKSEVHGKSRTPADGLDERNPACIMHMYGLACSLTLETHVAVISTS